MAYIDKSTLLAEIERRRGSNAKEKFFGRLVEDNYFLDFIDTLEVKDPYEQCVQYPSVKDGIKAHAETYSFNIESELFNQLTKEQQALWRKEIEQACISGGEAGVEWADETMLENACKWLLEHVDMYEAFDEESKTYFMDKDELISDLKKAMED